MFIKRSTKTLSEMCFVYKIVFMTIVVLLTSCSNASLPQYDKTDKIQTNIADDQVQQKEDSPQFVEIVPFESGYTLLDSEGNVYFWGEHIKHPTKDAKTGTLSYYTPEYICSGVEHILSATVWRKSNGAIEEYDLLTNEIRVANDLKVTDKNDQDFYLDENDNLWWKGTKEFAFAQPHKIDDNVKCYEVTAWTPYTYYAVGYLKKDKSYWISLLNYYDWGGELIMAGEKQLADAVKVMDNIKQISMSGGLASGIDMSGNAWVIENLYNMYEEPVRATKLLTDAKLVSCNAHTIAFVRQDGTLWQQGQIIGQPKEHELFIVPVERTDFPVEVSMDDEKNILDGRERMRKILTEDPFGMSSDVHEDALNGEKRNYYLLYFSDCFTKEELKKI